MLIRAQAALQTISLVLALSGCDSASDPGDSNDPPETPCGSGALTVVLGVGNPWEPVESPEFAIEAGRQGGFHTEVSLHTQGHLDPDHTDIELTLRLGDWAVGRHITDDWLLHLESGPYCDYPRARMVLLDEEGGLLAADRVEQVLGVDLELTVRLDSPKGGGVVTQIIQLSAPESH